VIAVFDEEVNSMPFALMPAAMFFNLHQSNDLCSECSTEALQANPCVLCVMVAFCGFIIYFILGTLKHGSEVCGCD
jgi:hypothetical protein